MAVPKLAKWYGQIASAAAGSIPAADIDAAGIVAAQIASDAVETAKIKDNAVTPAKMSDHYIDSAGITIAALTAAIAAPGTLVDGTIYVIRNTSDANKIYLVSVAGGAFFVSAAQAAAA